MAVRKLFQENVYIKEWTSEITKVTFCPDNKSENKYVINLKETAFFSEGGGQSCDIGEIEYDKNKWQVVDVQENGEEIAHTVVTDGKAPEVGHEVKCTLNWEHRFDNMQRHCGEHILSGICYEMFGGVNRGFHMGHEFMTIDISLEENPQITQITYQMAMEAELAANKVIWQNAPVTVMRFETREEAEGLPLRKALAFDEDISIVCIGSTDNASDCVACCGTHPDSAGQVGIIKIFKVEKYKGMFRIFFEAGERALIECDKRHDILYNLSNKYSSSIEELPQKLKAAEDKTAAVKKKLHQLTGALIDKEVDQLNNNLEKLQLPVAVHRLEVLDMDDAFNMAKRYMGDDGKNIFNQNKTKLIMLYAAQDTSFVLVSSGEPDCGKLVKEYASFYSGKGGGNNTSARAIFTNEEDAMLFADLLQKHLK